MPSGVYNHKSKQGFQKGHRQFAGFQKGNKLGKKFAEGHPCYFSGGSKKGRIRKKVDKKGRTNMALGQIKRWDKVGRKPLTKDRRTSYWEYRKWRSKVFERDNWTCQTCGERGCYLESHHIKSWVKYPKLRYDVENGVTLCLDCHKLTDNYKNKK